MISRVASTLIAALMAASSLVVAAPAPAPRPRDAPISFKPEFVGQLQWGKQQPGTGHNTSVVWGSGTQGGHLTVHQPGVSYGGSSEGRFQFSSAQTVDLNITAAGATGTPPFGTTYWGQLQGLDNDGSSLGLCLASSPQYATAPGPGSFFVMWAECTTNSTADLADQLWRADVANSGLIRFSFQGGVVSGRVGPATSYALREDTSQYGRIERYSSDEYRQHALWFYDAKFLN